ncbi:MAG: hypothetical protein WC924_02445 [Candidatus Gracilibacteria bacterium]
MARTLLGKVGKLHMWGLVLAVVLGVVFACAPHSYADFLPLPATDDLDVPAPEGDSAFEKLGNLLGPLARNLRIIVGGVALVFIVIAGFSMVIAGDNEENVKTQRKSLTYGVVGLLMISIAGPIAEVFDYRQGNFISDPSKLAVRAQLFDDTTRILITFVKYFLGGLGSLMFLRAGAKMIIQGDNEEVVNKEKKSLAVAAGGLLLVVVSDLVVRRVFYVTEFNTDADKTIVVIDQSEGLQQLVAVTNLVVSFVGPAMLLGIVAGGVLYLTAGGNDERAGLAKKIMINSIIGVIIIYGAFALVSTIIAGTF